MPPLPQLSTVCRRFAEAVRSMPSLATGLCIYGEFPSDVSLSSKLMLTWAPVVSRFRLSLPGPRLTGLGDFLSKASNLQGMTLVCSTLEAAGDADIVLSHCTGLQTLTVWALHQHQPCVWPLSLERLSISLAARQPAEHAKALNHVALCRMARLSKLQILNLMLHSSPFLASSIQLPGLHRLQLDLTLDSEVDLSWLRTQPYAELQITVFLTSTNPQHHASLVAAVQCLCISELSLIMLGSLPKPCLSAWAAVSSAVLTLVWTGDAAVCSFPHAVSRLAHIEDRTLSPSNTIELSWADLTRSPGRKAVYTWNLQALHVQGFSGHCPSFSDGQPWELAVRHDHGTQHQPDIEGLPASQCQHGFRLLNKAAIALGWDKVHVPVPVAEFKWPQDTR